MQIKISEATNEQINLLVAKVEKKQLALFRGVPCLPWGDFGGLPTKFIPTVSPVQAMEIIEQHGIVFRQDTTGKWLAAKSSDFAGGDTPQWPIKCSEGPTPFIASLRCLLTAELGETTSEVYLNESNQIVDSFVPQRPEGLMSAPQRQALIEYGNAREAKDPERIASAYAAAHHPNQQWVNPVLQEKMKSSLSEAVQGIEVVEVALLKAQKNDALNSPFPMIGKEASAYQKGLAAAYIHALEMIGTSVLKEALTELAAGPKQKPTPANLPIAASPSIGDSFKNIKDELDTDEYGQDRITPAGFVWVVTEINENGEGPGVPNYGLSCEATGAWIYPNGQQLSQDFESAEADADAEVERMRDQG